MKSLIEIWIFGIMMAILGAIPGMWIGMKVEQFLPGAIERLFKKIGI